ncbi:MAG: serine hydrolase domain-containing protein [Pseudomonadales bacterium]
MFDIVIRSFTIGLLALLLPGLLQAETFRDGKAESVGMSNDRLARIAPAIQGYIDRGEIAGAATLIARKGIIIHQDAQGYADLESERLLQTDSLFRLASQTKPVTAVAVMILLEQAKIRLNDPIARYLPEFTDIKVAELNENGKVVLVAPERPMTIKHLLTHTAGMSVGESKEVAEWINHMVQTKTRSPNQTLAEVVSGYAQLALGYHPGTHWQYSPAAGFNVLGRLVEVVSGQSLQDFQREHIFEPLGMKDTYYYVPLDKLDRYTVAYRRESDGSISPAEPADGTSRFVKEHRPKVMFPGAGGLVSTMHDYLRFAQMLMNGGELDAVRILSPKTVELMTLPHALGIPKIGGLGARGTAFGLGVNVVVEPAAYGEASSKGTYMWGGAFGTTFWIDPKEQLIGLYMMQLHRHQPVRVRSDYRALVYGAFID